MAVFEAGRPRYKYAVIKERYERQLEKVYERKKAKEERKMEEKFRKEQAELIEWQRQRDLRK